MLKSFFCMSLSLCLSLLVGMSPALGAGKEIALPAPAEKCGLDLMAALRERRSTRAFQAKGVPLPDLATVLWAANGLNRKDGKRTAPSAYGRYYLEIYAALAGGAYHYEPEGNKLVLVKAAEIREHLGTQGDIPKAPCVLIITARLNVFPFYVKSEARLAMAHATAGCVAQNVYLAAAALGLGTRLVGNINAKGIEQGLALKGKEEPLYIMPLGYAAD